MAYNDYELIVYKMLRYLYECLKKDVPVDRIYLTREYYDIPQKYWQFILSAMIQEDYITGILMQETKDGYVFSGLADAKITPRGIEFLHENSLMKKAERFLLKTKSIIPGI